MIAHVNPSAQRRVPHYIANSLGFLDPGMSAGGNMAQLPSGSKFSYTADFGIDLGLVGPDQVIADLASRLPQYGMTVTDHQILGGGYTAGLTGGSFQVTVLDSIGHALGTDAQSVLDSIVRDAVGSHSFQGSFIAITSKPVSSGAAPLALDNQNPPNPATTWLKEYWPLLAIAAGGAVALRKLL